MFRRILEKLAKLQSPSVPLELPGGDDPVARRTSWHPCKSGGTNFRTHRLVQVSPDRLEMKVTAGMVLFTGVFILFGSAALIGGLFAMREEGPGFLILLAFGAVFAGVGGFFLRSASCPIVFDRRKGSFWRGRKEPDQVFDKASLKTCVPLENIHALQIISEYVSGNKSSYHSYELNLVLKDAGRVNVVDHGNLERLRTDAAQLSAFLGVPVWDAA